MTSPLADPSMTAASASIYTDPKGLASLKRDAQAQTPESLRTVAQQFESIFAKMVLSSMRQASFGDSLTGSQQTEFYQGMFDDQLSVELTKGKGLGLADMLVRQLTQSGLVPKGTDDAARTVGDTSQSAYTASVEFISKMRSANAQPETGWQAGSQEEFVQKLWPCAEEAGRELGIDPRHLLAQAALETGWGKSLPCATDGSTSFNFFGIKAGNSWQGDSVSVKTLEFEGGVPVPRQAKFRAYDSPTESFRDYVDVLRNNPRYADALNTGSDAKAFANALQKGGYATDPAYANKIAAIAQNLPINETALKSSPVSPISPPIAIF
jgi:peptidoglycan hydrolase FlgJ